MFYRPEDGHGLPHNPFNAIVSPRPIGWISTRGPDGTDNLAPYSFFNAVAYTPPQVVFASTGRKPDRGDSKDSAANARDTGVFAVNIVSLELAGAMNATSGPWPRDTDEFALAGLAKAECATIGCPRVAAAPATLECQVVDVIPLKGRSNTLVIGEVTGIHLDDRFLVNGIWDTTLYQPLARGGYKTYSAVRELFEMTRPGED